MAGVGRYKSMVRCVIRSALNGFKISGIDFRRAAAQHPAPQNGLHRLQRYPSLQTQTNAARYAVLSIEARLVACLLDRSSLLASDNIPLTQGVLAEMMAVRRTSVTEEGLKLKAAGVIGYSRGDIQILDRASLLK
jgi:CRP-like cAMP-binding protein